MNVRFFAGTKQQYLSIPVHNEQALYFCEDTKELFWGDRLLTDGIRVVPTFADLPTRVEAIADGMLYYVTETRNGYVLSPDRTEWLQTIYAPVTDAYKVPESEIYNTVTTVGAVRDIEEKIYKAIDDVKTECTAKAISFAGIEMEEIDGVFTIDRACARRAIGFNVPEGMEDAELSIATEDYVKNAIAEAELNNKEVDLEAYYTKDQVDALIPDISKFITEIPSEYVTEEELDAKGYITEHQDLSHLAEKDHTHDNYADKQHEHEQYLTEHQDLSEYAKKAELFSKDYNDLDNKPTIPSIYGLATEEYVNNAISNIEIPEVDLEGYAKLSDIPDVSKFIEEIPAEYITEAELDEKGFLTEHQDLSEYAKKSDIPNTDEFITMTDVEAKNYLTEVPEGFATESFVKNAIAEAELSDKDVDLSGLATKDEIKDLASISYVDEKVAEIDIPTIPTNISAFTNDAGYLTEHQDLSEYAKKSELPTDYITTIPDEYITEAELAEELAKIEHPAVNLDDYATKDFVNTAIDGIEIPEDEIYKVDFNVPDFAAAIEAYNNGKLLLLVNAAPDANGYAVMNYVRADLITFTKFLTSRSETYGSFNTYYLHSDNTWEVSKEVRLNKVEANIDGEVNGELTSVRIGKEIYSIPNTDGLASIEYVDNAIAGIEVPNVDNFITMEQVEAKNYLTVVPEEYAKKADIPSTEGLATEEYVQEQIDAINITETDLSNYYTKSEVDNAKANNVPFTTDKYVTKALGGFNIDDNLKDMNILDILAKLLGLSDQPSQGPDEPDTPDEPQGIIENIMANEIPMYSITDDGILAEASFKIINGNEAPTESGFYEIKDEQGNILEAGYQDLQVENDEMYYVIALPKEVDYNTMVEVETYDPDEKVWNEATITMTSDPDVVAACCDEVGIDISHIDQEHYTVWVQEDICTGSIIRYRIIEEV